MEFQKTEKIQNNIYTQDRELSWLKFNKRVLEEAQDTRVPLLERFKFISIFTSNLDEFYMIRVGRLNDLSKMKIEIKNDKSDMTPKEQLTRIFDKTNKLIDEREKTYLEIVEELKKNGIYDLKFSELDKNEKKQIENYYRNRIQPVLSPLIIDSQHPFPHLANKQSYIIVNVKDKEKSEARDLYKERYKKERNKEIRIGIIPIPTNLVNLIYLEDDDKTYKMDEIRFIRIEEIILEYTEQLFGQFETGEKTLVSVTRNADLDLNEELEEDDGEDYRHHMKKLLKRRARLLPVRLEVMGKIGEEEKKFLIKRLKISEEQIFESKVPINLGYAFELPEKISSEKKKLLCDKVFEPQYPKTLSTNKKIRITEQVKKNDMLFHYPYEQIDPFINLLKESANDPNVISIKITMYRLALRSKIAEQLCEAAENGKEVNVLMELKARFDEQNNIAWAERLEESGCNIIYGLEDLKVHSKICLITRNDIGRINYITQIGTGNYNEKTAKLYSDFSLITANQEIGKDANNFFKNMMISNLEGQYKVLWIAPNSLKQNIINAIDEEIKKAKAGIPGKITIKANSLTERTIIDKLSEASQAGVKINLIIRGICCILPGIEGYTENIKVISLVGRFLEHHRIYMFGEGDEKKIYISSADLMTRNLIRRIEIACPILDLELKRKIENMVETILKDNVKARELRSDGTYVSVLPCDENIINAQEEFIEESKEPMEENETVRAIDEKSDTFKAVLKKISELWKFN
ncbi:MAG: polyphosphate kinase 1 [Proteocatella sp.]